ncbi:hypothetical protein [Micromonospora maris]|uniref:DUF6414 family protein n=1 Tax=Micromonospora maris TaxID=1003110 RepID=UPI0011D249EF|nr:hypothetical protein [Micromonospora maris]
MGTYQKPKKNLHREFIYLNHDSVLNSLSAFEAGQVDQILEKTSEASEGGVDAGLGFKGTRVGGSKKRQGSIQEELVRTRTRFSSFESWLQRLTDEGAIGSFDEWDMQVRDQISAGDTIHFTADVYTSPLYKLVTAFSSFADNPAMFGTRQQDNASNKRQAKMMESWITGNDGNLSVAVYLRPNGVSRPRIIARLSANYLVSGLSNIEERYQVIAQVRTILRPNEKESLLRILKNAPPVPIEVETVTEAMKHMQEGAAHLRVPFDDDDLSFTHPDVIVHPIAIFK